MEIGSREMEIGSREMEIGSREMEDGWMSGWGRKKKFQVPSGK